MASYYRSMTKSLALPIGLSIIALVGLIVIAVMTLQWMDQSARAAHFAACWAARDCPFML